MYMLLVVMYTCTCCRSHACLDMPHFVYIVHNGLFIRYMYVHANVLFLLQFQRKVEESEKKFQSAQGRLEELAALKKRISDMEKNNKSLEASKEVLYIHHVSHIV